MPLFQEHEPMYRAFADFIQRCIFGNQSLILPDRRAWTADNVKGVKERVVDHPEFDTNLNFEDKLRKQMTGASADQWLVLADVHYLYSLPSRSMKLTTKIGQVRWVAQQGGITAPSETDPCWAPLEIGFSRTGQRFHLRYLQLWLILIFANALKEQELLRSQLGEYRVIQTLLDELLGSITTRNDRAYDMRHAILYLMYPDQYEPIINTTHKDTIIKTFGKRVGTVLPSDKDAALKQIRSMLSNEFDQDGIPFNYYRPPLVDQWKTEAPTVITATIESGSQLLPKSMDSTQTPPEVVKVLTLLKRIRNIIFQGPPGTGKTYIAMRAAKALVEPQLSKPLTEDANIQRVVTGLTIYDTIALSMYVAGKDGKYSVNELLEQKVLRGREKLFKIQSPRQTLWSTLGTHTTPTSQSVEVQRRIPPYIFDKTDNSRWYLTNEGRDYVKVELAQELALLQSTSMPESDEYFIERVTFHQSFAYEDFVEGWRPIKEGDASDMSYKVQPGILKRIASRAEADASNKYVLVIDEINRGNIAKILGELITLLEDDKRIGQPNEVRLTLPYSGDSFGLPSNLYIMGTMNTADRSIALLDVALRRRFSFVDVMPNPDLLTGVLVPAESGAVDLGELLERLNRGIAQALDRNYQIGHSYFFGIKQLEETERVGELEFVWNTQILPLLEEYFYGQREVLANILRGFVEGNVAEAWVEFDRLLGDELIFALQTVVQNKVWAGDS